MDDFWWLARGLAIGIAVAIPIGPMALLCMRRTLERGFLIGFATGFGAAMADLFYSAIAAFGISAVEDVLLEYRTPLSFIGGMFLLVLAARTAMGKATVEREVRGIGPAGAAGALVSGFVLTATNPLTVLGFVAIFAGFGVGQGLTDISRAVALVIGVTIGSVLWWLVLNTIIARIRHFFAPRTLQHLNLAAGAIIGAFAFYELSTAVMMAAPWLF